MKIKRFEVTATTKIDKYGNKYVMVDDPYRWQDKNGICHTWIKDKIMLLFGDKKRLKIIVEEIDYADIYHS